MDRLITDDLDEDERKVLLKKMETLVDLYYLALDAPKTGMKVNSVFEYTVCSFKCFYIESCVPALHVISYCNI